MIKIYILSVGRLKEAYWREAAEHFRFRLLRAWEVREVFVKDESSAPTPALRIEREGGRLLSALPAGVTPIALHQEGDNLPSPALAQYLRKLFERAETPCFIIGGAYGLSQAVLARASRRLSLGPLTFTHELAQVILWEQLFRADSILRGTGYHH